MEIEFRNVSFYYEALLKNWPSSVSITLKLVIANNK